jgi:hypothetical protein
VETGHLDGAGVRDPQPLDAFDGRRLARAVRAEDSEDLAFLHGEGHPVHGGPAPVGLSQAVHFDNRHVPDDLGGRRSSASPIKLETASSDRLIRAYDRTRRPRRERVLIMDENGT